MKTLTGLMFFTDLYREGVGNLSQRPLSQQGGWANSYNELHGCGWFSSKGPCNCQAGQMLLVIIDYMVVEANHDAECKCPGTVNSLSTR